MSLRRKNPLSSPRSSCPLSLQTKNPNRSLNRGLPRSFENVEQRNLEPLRTGSAWPKKENRSRTFGMRQSTVRAGVAQWPDELLSGPRMAKSRLSYLAGRPSEPKLKAKQFRRKSAAARSPLSTLAVEMNNGMADFQSDFEINVLGRGQISQGRAPII